MMIFGRKSLFPKKLLYEFVYEKQERLAVETIGVGCQFGNDVDGNVCR